MSSKTNYIREIEKNLNNNHLKKAKIVLDDLLKMKDVLSDPYISFLIAVFHIKNEEYELSIPHLYSIVKSSTTSIFYFKATKLLAYANIKLENFQKAQYLLLEVEKELIEDLEVKNMLAFTYYSLGEIETSFKRYIDIIELDKENTTALNAISYCLVDQYNKPEEALKLLEHYSLEDPRILDTIGWAYFHLQKYSQAEVYLKQAFEKMPKSNIIKDHMNALIVVQ